MIADRAFAELDALDAVTTIRVVDVGCHKAHFRDAIRCRKAIWSLGIDPCDYGVGAHFDLFLPIAVDDVADAQTRPFFHYIEPGCNSLLPMNMDLITHDPARPKGKWFVGWPIERVERVTQVPVHSLCRVLEVALPAGGLVHFLKIDAQGADLRVIRSLGERLRDVLFLQTEAVASHDPAVTLYRGQTILEDEVAEMSRRGFEVFGLQDYSAQASPEADVVYVNRALWDELRAGSAASGRTPAVKIR